MSNGSKTCAHRRINLQNILLGSYANFKPYQTPKRKIIKIMNPSQSKIDSPW